SSRSSSLCSIVDRIRPSVEALWETDLRQNREALLQQAVRANIRSSVVNLRHGSQILEQFIQHDGLRVVGAEYSLETGIVDFYEDLAEEKA
ncbi:MAG: carbonic anhydrase, partial [Pseudomonadales bacterium]